MTAMPLDYASGTHPQFGATLMPGLVNAHGALAVGLSGEDGGLFRAARRGTVVDGVEVDLEPGGTAAEVVPIREVDDHVFVSFEFPGKAENDHTVVTYSSINTNAGRWRTSRRNSSSNA